MRHTFSLILILVTLSSAVHAQAWDPAPFRSATPIPRDGLPSERGAFLAWLDQNPSPLSQKNFQRVHERLYAYISDIAKRQGGGFPAEPIPWPSTCSGWRPAPVRPVLIA